MINDKNKTDQHRSTVKKNSQRAWGATKEVDVTKSHNTIISKTTPCLIPDEQVLSRLLTVSKATTASGVTLNTVRSSIYFFLLCLFDGIMNDWNCVYDDI